MLQENLADFSVGEVLSKSFSTLFRNIVPFTIISFILWTPVTLYFLFIDQSQEAIASNEAFVSFVENFAAIFGLILVFVLIFIVLNYLIYGAITFGAIRDLQGKQAGIGEILGRGFSTVLPVIGVAIVSSLAILLAAIAFLIPGIIVTVMLFVAIPVAVVERPGVFESLSRSADLTKGVRWKVFGILLVVVIINLVFSGFSQTLMLGLGTTGIILDSLVTSILTAFGAVNGAVTYLELRSIKEGVDIDTIAQVFA